MIQRSATFLTLLLGAATALFMVWPWLPGVSGRVPRTITLYGFSILAEVMNQGVFPAFQREWQASHGERVELVSSFAGSGTVTNQLIMGVPGQIAILSLELDALKLQARQVVAGPSWRQLPNAGVLNRTPFVILVRPGNPLGIHDFADLARPGVKVVHPDPLTSGGAQWAILAEYGSAARNGQDPHQLLLGIWRNVVAQAASARAARTQFEGGFGDALITYEQELISDAARGKLKGEIVYPRSTILSEHTVVVLDRNIGPDERELVHAFVDFLWSRPAQEIFVRYGFRSPIEELNPALPVQDPFTVADLGGWPEAKKTIVDGLWKNRVLSELHP